MYIYICVCVCVQTLFDTLHNINPDSKSNMEEPPAEIICQMLQLTPPEHNRVNLLYIGWHITHILVLMGPARKTGFCYLVLSASAKKVLAARVTSILLQSWCKWCHTAGDGRDRKTMRIYEMKDVDGDWGFKAGFRKNMRQHGDRWDLCTDNFPWTSRNLLDTSVCIVLQ